MEFEEEARHESGVPWRGDVGENCFLGWVRSNRCVASGHARSAFGGNGHPASTEPR